MNGVRLFCYGPIEAVIEIREIGATLLGFTVTASDLVRLCYANRKQDQKGH